VYKLALTILQDTKLKDVIRSLARHHREDLERPGVPGKLGDVAGTKLQAHMEVARESQRQGYQEQ